MKDLKRFYGTADSQKQKNLWNLIKLLTGIYGILNTQNNKLHLQLIIVLTRLNVLNVSLSKMFFCEMLIIERKTFPFATPSVGCIRCIVTKNDVHV